MKRTFSISAAISVLMLGLASAALAATGEYGNMDAMALAQGQIVKTDCSISSQLEGKTYCFGNEEAKDAFMKDPAGNVAKAEEYYSKHKG